MFKGRNYNFINLTPHTVTISSQAGIIDIAPEGPVARITSGPDRFVGTFDFAPVYDAASRKTEITGLPDMQPDTFLIVSTLVAQSLRSRSDLLAPGTGPNDKPIRDDQGQIISVTRLISYYDAAKDPAWATLYN